MNYIEYLLLYISTYNSFSVIVLFPLHTYFFFLFHKSLNFRKQKASSQEPYHHIFLLQFYKVSQI